MNKERIEYCIELMKDAKNLNMDYFQFSPTGKKVSSIDDLHRCGNVACLAGYLAISDRFKAEGGISRLGAPEFNHYLGASAVAEYLDISWRDAEALCLDIQVVLTNDGYLKSTNGAYPVLPPEVKPEHVIEKLQILLEKGGFTWCPVDEDPLDQ